MKKKKYTKNFLENEPVNKKKKTKTGPIMVLIIIVLMVGSTLYLSLSNTDKFDNTNIIEYNNYKFQREQQGYSLKYNDIKIGFEYLPEEIKNIPILTDIELDKETYILFDPEELKEDSLEINRLIALLYVKNIRAYPACIKEKGCGNIPIINCKTAKNYLFITFKNETKITREDGCIILQTNQAEIFRVIDRFVYNIYGIMK